MTKVLVVEDSRVVRDLLVHILNSDADINVVDTAGDGCEAVEKAERLQPDVITMDVHMPRMSGLDAVRAIMSTHPIPTVIISASMDPGEVVDAFVALEAGALALCEKPVSIDHPDFKKQAKRIVQTVKMVSQVAVVRKRPPAYASEPAPHAGEGGPRERVVKIVAVGASTGGPPVLNRILSGLPRGFAVPLLIVQHIAAGFLPGLVDWLCASSGFPVTIAEHGGLPTAGRGYIAPDGAHMEVDRNGRIVLRKGLSVNGMCPSVSVLFGSMARAFGPAAAGVLLTGMGRDGAEELKVMRDLGSVTIAQDSESSVVHGMPGIAISLGAAGHVLPPEAIAHLLAGLVEGADG